MEPAKTGIIGNSYIIVKALVIRADGKVLVLRRSSDDADSPGRLDLPGGGIEFGESYAQAITREIKEEAGIIVSGDETMLAYAFTRYEDSSSVPKIRLLYAVRVADPVVRLSHEHDEYWWRTPKELMTLFADISWGEAIRVLNEHNLASAKI